PPVYHLYTLLSCCLKARLESPALMPALVSNMPAMVLFLDLFNTVFDVEFVHVPGVVPNDHAVHHQGALGSHPETERPTKEVEAQLTGEIAHDERHHKPDC